MSTSTINSKKIVKAKESVNEDVSHIMQPEQEEELPVETEQEEFRE